MKARSLIILGLRQSNDMLFLEQIRKFEIELKEGQQSCGTCSTHTRMKSLPKPWYFVNSSVFACLAMATCLVLRAFLPGLFKAAMKHWLGPAEKEGASSARTLQLFKSSMARKQPRQPLNHTL